MSTPNPQFSQNTFGTIFAGCEAT